MEQRCEDVNLTLRLLHGEIISEVKWAGRRVSHYTILRRSARAVQEMHIDYNKVYMSVTPHWKSLFVYIYIYFFFARNSLFLHSIQDAENIYIAHARARITQGRKQ